MYVRPDIPRDILIDEDVSVRHKTEAVLFQLSRNPQFGVAGVDTIAETLDIIIDSAVFLNRAAKLRKNPRTAKPKNMDAAQ